MLPSFTLQAVGHAVVPHGSQQSVLKHLLVFIKVASDPRAGDDNTQDSINDGDSKGGRHCTGEQYPNIYDSFSWKTKDGI